jgi:DNA/RNA-binding protein KIN17
MNVTKWNSLTEFAKYLGREGICVVEEKEDGFFIAWIDRSPEALRRKETLLKKERERRTDERIEQKQLEDQVRRAEQAKISGGQDGAVEPAVLKGEDNGILAPGQKLSLKFGSNTAKSGEQGQKPATSDSTPTLASTKPKNILAPSKKNVFKKSGSSGKSTSGDSKTQSNGKRQEQFAFDGLGEKDHRPKKVRLA